MVSSNEFIENTLAEYFSFRPDAATLSGYEGHDGEFPDYSEEGVNLIIDFARQTFEKANSLRDDAETFELKHDYQIICHVCDMTVFQIEMLGVLKTNPLMYVSTATAPINVLYGRHKSGDASVAAGMKKWFKNAPAFFRQAAENLSECPGAHVETATKQLAGFSAGLDQFGDVKGIGPKAISTAKAAINEFTETLNGKVAEDTEAFRLGAELYEHYFLKTTQVGLKPVELRMFAEYELMQTHARMAELAKTILGDAASKHDDDLSLISAAVAVVNKDHGDAEDLKSKSEEIVEELRNFVIENNLAPMPEEYKLNVEWMPPHMRGVAIAYVLSAGGFGDAKDTFYYILPVHEETADAKAVQSFLEEYNDSMLRILTIHEAMPGHYVQIALSREGDRPIRRAFGNGTSIEGWAVFCEEMMLRNGYGDGDAALELMRLKFFCRTIVNTMIDIAVHTDKMGKEEVIDLLKTKGFQTDTEAEGKWQRVQLTAAQLCAYYAGYFSIKRLEEEVKSALGDKFDQGTFNKHLLTTAGAPIPIARREVLRAFELQ